MKLGWTHVRKISPQIDAGGDWQAGCSCCWFKTLWSTAGILLFLYSSFTFFSSIHPPFRTPPLPSPFLSSFVIVILPFYSFCATRYFFPSLSSRPFLCPCLPPSLLSFHHLTSYLLYPLALLIFSFSAFPSFSLFNPGGDVAMNETFKEC